MGHVASCAATCPRSDLNRRGYRMNSFPSTVHSSLTLKRSPCPSMPVAKPFVRRRSTTRVAWATHASHISEPHPPQSTPSSSSSLRLLTAAAAAACARHPHPSPSPSPPALLLGSRVRHAERHLALSKRFCRQLEFASLSFSNACLAFLSCSLILPATPCMTPQDSRRHGRRRSWEAVTYLPSSRNRRHAWILTRRLPPRGFHPTSSAYSGHGMAFFKALALAACSPARCLHRCLLAAAALP